MNIYRVGLFFAGAAVGAGAVYLLQDERVREQAKKLVENGIKFYDGALGGIETVKEDVQDMVAEARSSSEVIEESVE